MVERRERIPADEVAESKNWNLPFWTEPASVIKAREKEESETTVEEEEIEIEPLTAEQLEQIRQEAYNEGLQQGLVEGRQKGEKLGIEEGREEGLKLGQEEGRKLGFEAGSDEGKSQALQEGKKQTDDTINQLQTVITNLESQFSQQKTAMEELLPELVIMLSQAVVSEELDQGSAHIVALVNTALEALPLSQAQLSIEVHALDLPHLEAAFQGSKFASCLVSNDDLEPGGCRLYSEYSTVDFSLSERWQSVLSSYHSQLQLGLLHGEDSDKDDSEKSTGEIAEENPEQNPPISAESKTPESPATDAPSDDDLSSEKTPTAPDEPANE